MTEGPKRLFETEIGDLGRALSVAREQVPSAEQLDRLAERLARAGATLPEPRTADRAIPEPTRAAETLSPVAKAVIGAVGVGALVVGGAFVASRGQRERPAAPVASIEATAASARVLPSVPVSEPPPATKAPTSPREGTPLAPAPVERPPAAEPAPSAPPNVQREPIAPKPAAAEEPRPTPRASEGVPAAPLAREVATRGSASPGTIDVETPPESEVELLKRARSTATNDPAQALAITARHRAEFPNGAYAQERDLIVITALLRLGRRSEATARAEAFRARYPRSAYLPQIERMLGAR